jgi:GDP-D-mannose dehydratase
MAKEKIMSENTALVVGISGITGRTLADHLAALGDWTVLGVSRRTPDDLGATKRR